MSTRPPTSRRRHAVVAAAVAAVLAATAAVAVWAPGGAGEPAGSEDTGALAGSTQSGSTPTGADPSDEVVTTTGPAVPVRKPRPAPPVDLTETAAPGDGISLEVTSLEWVEGKALIPGEVGGPALRITLEARNDGTEPVDSTGSVVNFYYGPDSSPGTPLLKPGGAPFSQVVPAGGSARGVYVFRVPERRDSIRIRVEVDLGRALRVIEFRGRPGVAR